MKKGQAVGKDKNGNTLYFIAFSVMKYNGSPLLLCHTNPEATPEMCGHYTQKYLLNTVF